MRRTLIALGTATALTLGVVPAVSAHASSLDSLSSQVEELPADMRLGSSGAEMISSTGTDTQKQQGSMLLGHDWIIGFAALTVLGTIIQAVMSATR